MPQNDRLCSAFVNCIKSIDKLKQINKCKLKKRNQV